MSDIPLIDPETIELESKVRDKKVTVAIGYYSATEGARLLGLVSECIASAAKSGGKDVVGMFGGNLSLLAKELCKYSAVQLSSGNWQRLDNEILINAHIPDYETLLNLVVKIHDYNSFFFSTTRLLTASHGFLSQAKAQATKIFQALSDSLSPKAKRRSKN